MRESESVRDEKEERRGMLNEHGKRNINTWRSRVCISMYIEH